MTAAVPAPEPDDTRLRTFRVVATSSRGAGPFAEPAYADVVAADYKVADPGVYRFLLADAWVTAEFPLVNVFGVIDLGPVRERHDPAELAPDRT